MKLLGKGINRVFALAWVLAVVALVVWQWPTYLFLQSDTFWLIETGRYIIEHHCLPTVDIYSFTRFGSPWFVYQWLFELVLAALFQLGGWLAISLFAVVALAWMFFVSMVRGVVRNGGDALLAFLMVCFGCGALMPDLVSIRPQLLTFLFLWLVQVNLDQFMTDSNGSWKRLLWLPLIMLLWVNVHISFVIELLVLAVYLMCALARKLAWRPLLAALLLCLAVSLVNPHGWGVYSFLYQSWQEHIVTPELRQISWTGQPVLLLFVVVTVAAFVISCTWWLQLPWGRGLPACFDPGGAGILPASPAAAHEEQAGCLRPQSLLPRTLLAGIFLAAGLSGARFIEYFVVWTMPVAAEMLTILGRNIVSGQRFKGVSESLGSLISSRAYGPIVLLLAAFVTTARPTVFPPTIPVKAAEYFAAHKPGGRLFCGEHAGSYLIFRFQGAIPVFIDTRVDVYGRDFCRRFSWVMVDGQGWQELTDRYQIKFAMMMNKYRLADMLRQWSQWRVVYTDNAYTIFQRGN